jgi:hypothetical protein
MLRRAKLALLVLAVTSVLGSCKQEERAGDNPPPPPSAAKPGACATGGGEVGDAVSAAFFPQSVGAYCLDPQNDTKTYGEKGKLSMDDVCTTALDGECEVYKRFGLTRLVALRYVDGGASGGSVEVYLSQFKDVPGGYAMFTKRVVADGDPADPSAPRPLAAGGAGAIGTGRAYVWKGPYLAELQYNNEQESPEQLAKSSDVILSTLGREIGKRLPGASNKPEAAELLPLPDLLPNAITYLPKDALDVAGAGSAAVGYYKDKDNRWRMIAMAPGDPGQAKDTMKIFRARPGALPIANLGDEAVHVVVQSSREAPKAEWLLVRKGPFVVGVGDESFSAKPGETPVHLSADFAMAKVRPWLASLGAAPSVAQRDAAKN